MRWGRVAAAWSPWGTRVPSLRGSRPVWGLVGRVPAVWAAPWGSLIAVRAWRRWWVVTLRSAILKKSLQLVFSHSSVIVLNRYLSWGMGRPLVWVALVPRSICRVTLRP